MQDLLESPAPANDSSEMFSGYRGSSSLEPQPKLPGFFDAEVNQAITRISNLGGEVTNLVLRAPATIFGWIFEPERPWWPKTKG